MMWNNYTTGTTIPTTAKGRGIAYNKQGQAVEVQGFWTPDPYQTDAEHPRALGVPRDLQLVENMRPKKRIHDIMKIVDLEDDVIDVDEKGKPIYADYGHHMATPIINAGDPELIERERKILGDAEGDIRREKLAAQVALLERIQIEEEEPEISDEAEMFSGYSPAIDQFPEELLVEGELRAEGILILVDEDSDTWGLVEFAEEDEEDITFSYRDFRHRRPRFQDHPHRQHPHHAHTTQLGYGASRVIDLIDTPNVNRRHGNIYVLRWRHVRSDRTTDASEEASPQDGGDRSTPFL